jgi:hypothetical protein
MRNWVSIVITAAFALAIGYSLRPVSSVHPSSSPRTDATAPKTVDPLYKPDSGSEVSTLPTYPKPSLEPPVATSEPSVPAFGTSPEPLVGNFPALPSAGTGGPRGSIGPLDPNVPTKLPTADLNADEALARRTVLQSGGEIVASSDAKDSTGKVGRTLVAEVASASATELRSALRKALGDRVVLSDAGTVPSSSPTLRKAEEALAAAKKQVEQARIDFLPQAPALRQMEEDYLAQERAVAQQRRASGHLRLNILLRPTLGG